MERLPKGLSLRVTCFEPFTKQKKTFDEHRDGWDVSLDLLRSDYLRGLAIEEIRWVEGLDLSKCLPARQDCQNAYDAARQRGASARSDKTKDAAQSIIAADVQHRLCDLFRNFVKDLAKEHTEDAAGRCVTRWRDAAVSLLRDVLDRACFFSTAGSPLRRLEAAEITRKKLDQTLEKLAESDRKLPSGPASKRESEPQKRGRA
jgi:hypothetical protein